MDSPDNITPTRSRGILVPAVLWLIFCAGLIIQAFSPHLAIEHNAFVIPAESVPSGATVDPRALVSRQRQMQATSAMLVLVGVVGLAIWYRDALLRSLPRTGAR